MNKIANLSAITLVLILGITSNNLGSEKKAVTWTTIKYIKDGKKGGYALVGADNLTNAYQGDVAIDQSLSILCIKKANLPKPQIIPPPTRTPGGAWRGTWSGGYIGLTNPVQGIRITSLAVANQLCTKKLGDGYRMAEFHDGDPDVWAGWDFWGTVVFFKKPYPVTQRFWVNVNDQSSNPWQ